MIDLLAVIWIDDDTIDPPHPKMVACVNNKDGWFLRFNSKDTIKPCIRAQRDPYHPFLKYDSYLDCHILELDDYRASCKTPFSGNQNGIGCSTNTNRSANLAQFCKCLYVIDDSISGLSRCPRLLDHAFPGGCDEQRPSQTARGKFSDGLECQHSHPYSAALQFFAQPIVAVTWDNGISHFH